MKNSKWTETTERLKHLEYNIMDLEEEFLTSQAGVRNAIYILVDTAKGIIKYNTLFGVFTSNEADEWLKRFNTYQKVT